MPSGHLQPHRGWTLVRNKLQFTASEKKHLESCERCNYWLTGFTEMAKRAGFEITYQIPKIKPKSATDKESELLTD
jgi:hypothetical protein